MVDVITPLFKKRGSALTYLLSCFFSEKGVDHHRQEGVAGQEGFYGFRAFGTWHFEIDNEQIRWLGGFNEA